MQAMTEHLPHALLCVDQDVNGTIVCISQTPNNGFVIFVLRARRRDPDMATSD